MCIRNMFSPLLWFDDGFTSLCCELLFSHLISRCLFPFSLEGEVVSLSYLSCHPRFSWLGFPSLNVLVHSCCLPRVFSCSPWGSNASSRTLFRRISCRNTERKSSDGNESHTWGLEQIEDGMEDEMRDWLDATCVLLSTFTSAAHVSREHSLTGTNRTEGTDRQNEIGSSLLLFSGRNNTKRSNLFSHEREKLPLSVVFVLDALLQLISKESQTERKDLISFLRGKGMSNFLAHFLLRFVDVTRLDSGMSCLVLSHLPPSLGYTCRKTERKVKGKTSLKMSNRKCTLNFSQVSRYNWSIDGSTDIFQSFV